MSSGKNQSDLIVSVSGVRGIIGDSLTVDVAYQYGLSFGKYCQGKVIIGRDSRPSGVQLKKAAIHGLVDASCEVIDVDIAATPTIEMTVLEQKAQGGVIVTASHNPSQWNGLKFLRSDSTFLRQQEIKNIFNHINNSAHVRMPRIDTVKILDGGVDYHLDKIVELLNLEKIQKKNFSIALDTVNGAGGEIALKLLEKLNCRVFSMNTEMHGNFAHWPEPTPANLASFSQFITQHKVDIGFALDPDADRLVLALPSGEILNEEYTLALVVSHYLSNIKKGTVVVNQSTSRLNEDVAQKYGCRLVRSSVGEINVVEAMIDQKAVCGGEGNGGVIDPRLHYGRDALVGMALILELLTFSGQSIDQMIAEWPHYTILKEKISTNGQVFTTIAEKLKAKFNDAEIVETDGVRFAWPDHWLHIRPSNTEPIIRIIAESPLQESSQDLIQQAKGIVE